MHWDINAPFLKQQYFLFYGNNNTLNNLLFSTLKILAKTEHIWTTFLHDLLLLFII